MINLAAALPLSTPLSLILDINSGCNFACGFCVTGNRALMKEVGRPPRMMSFSLFTKIMNDMRDFPEPIGTIQLYKLGESTLNKNLPMMVAFAKDFSPKSRLELTTNASVLTRGLSGALIAAGLDYIRISVEHVHDEGYRQVTNRAVRYADILDNGRALWDQRQRMGSKTPEIHVKIADAGMLPIERDKFFRDWRGISDSIATNSLFSWPGQPATALGTAAQTGMDGVTPIKTDRVACPSPFRMMAIESDGLVTSCCVDFSGATAIGDANTESLAAIWNGPRMKAFRMMHLEGRRAENSACRDCGYMLAQAQESDLDAARERLIEVYR